MEDDMKAKQDYLFNEIIDKNYDPEEFQSYIQTIKGLSLELYSLPELTAIVHCFKKGEKYQSEPKLQADSIQMQASFVQPQEVGIQLQSQMNQQLLSVNSNPISTSNSSNNIYHQFLVKSALSSLYTRIHENKQKIHVKIRSYSKIQEESFFASSYVSYLIQTPELGWTVRRRFNEFEWLQSKMAQLFPGFPVPPIPKKTALRSFDDKHLEQRMNTFERYLNKLLSIPEICSEPIFQQFLKVGNESQFSSCKQRFDLTLKTRGNKVITLKGQNLLDKSQYRVELDEYEYYKKSRDILRTLNQQIATLQTLLKQTTDKAFQVSSILTELHQHLSSKQVEGAIVLELMGEFVSELGYKLEREHSFVQKQLQNFWHYQEKYIDNILSHMRRINQEHNDMLKKFKSLSDFEVDPEQNPNDNPTQPKLFQDYQQVREDYVLKLSFLRSEVTRFQQNNFSLAAKEWAAGLQTYIGGVKDLMISGVDQLTKAQCAAEGRKLIEVEYIGKKGGNGVLQRKEKATN